jgi:Na+/proline symporter
MASHGTDQLMVQRLLAARTQGESRTALIASWLVIFVQFSMFLVIGVMLFVFYSDSGLAAPQPADRIYPEFVWNHLPVGAAGIVVAAILAAAMANISAALNSLASTTIMDFYRPLSRRKRPESDYLKLARAATIVWGVVLLGIGILARKWGSVLEAGLAIASIPFGALLGVFLLGVLTRRVRENAAIAGMVTGLATMTYVRFFTSIAWTWYVLIGACVTFAAAWLAGWLSGSAREAVEAPR